MIHLRRRTLWERFLRLFPKHRARQDEEVRKAIIHLVNNPSEPCLIERQLIIPSWDKWDK